eukprot:CAMPEP_0170271920 /NCGR_PEP_ID=MMETSP0116_2-20130129/35912_1 /TAXON_ID=400756 /ORGANISM="Durinskia baltica, Strain CSIRO CS-38" /LENGTH=320 /DNA_ID=CAMNT_0010523127 /DNA_START=72 /DNA_END=1034 /DNA_ORIENTATION=+
MSQCESAADAATKASAPVYKSHHFDSTKWEAVSPRDDDIIIVTAYKSGTTWTQQLVSELVFQGKEKPASVSDLSPWVDLRVPPAEVIGPALEAQRHRRFLKTHLPADAFQPFFNPKAKYIFVGRDGRDAFMSLANHYEKASDAWYGALNDALGRVGPPIPHFSKMGDIATWFDRWLSEGWPTLEGETDGWPFWSYFKNARTWWQLGKEHDNILFLHFNDMKKDLEGEMRRVAAHLGIDVDEALLPQMVKACTFDEMHKKADNFAPLNGSLWANGGKDFMFKGTNQRWVGVLSDRQVEMYQEKAKRELPADCAEWLERGSR